MQTVLRASLAVLAASGVAACLPAQVEDDGKGRGARLGGGGVKDAGAKDAGADSGPAFSLPDVAPTDTSNAGGEGEAGSCAGEIHEAKLVPVDLLFLLDTSGSMEEMAGTKSKWMSVRDAITSFIGDARSDGLGVGLRTFPAPPKRCTKDSECGGKPEHCGQKGACGKPADVARVEAACYTVSPLCLDGQPCTRFGLCSGSGLRCADIGRPCPGGMPGDTCVDRPRYCTDMRGASCSPGVYQAPQVPIAALPGVRPAFEMAMAAVVPEGATPTTPAAEGALAYLREHAAANADRKQLLVFATDGMPSMCPPNNSVETTAAALMAARAAGPSIASYVIGVFSPAQLDRARPALEQMATAGGAGAPFILTAGDDLTQKFVEAIDEIRSAAQTCDFMIPKPTAGALDYDKVNVRITSRAGNEDLAYVGAADACDTTKGGWHYDVRPTAGTPTRVVLCPASCRKTKVSVGLAVDLRFGCRTIVVE
jgi:hypothetical protein